MTSYAYHFKRGFTEMRTLKERPAAPVVCTRNATVRAVTIIEPELRSKIDLVAGTTFSATHVDSIEAACIATRNHTVGALLLSPMVLETGDRTSLKKLLHECPGYSFHVVVRELMPHSGDALLQLGACGVQSVINLSQRHSWSALRSAVLPTEAVVAKAILDALLPALSDATCEVRRFFGELARRAPRARTMKSLSSSFGVSSSTLCSRFFRARLPSAKYYLSMFRLLHLVALLENRAVSLAHAANRLEYSSPQSLSRHIRITLGVSAHRLRDEIRFDGLLRNVTERLVLPYRVAFQAFQPLGNRQAQRVQQIGAIVNLRPS